MPTSTGGMCLEWFRKNFSKQDEELEALNHHLRTSEGGVIGSVFLAGLGVGAISDPGHAIKRFVVTDQEWKPDTAQAETYRKMIPIYAELLEISRRIHKLIYQSAIHGGAL